MEDTPEADTNRVCDPVESCWSSSEYVSDVYFTAELGGNETDVEEDVSNVDTGASVLRNLTDEVIEEVFGNATIGIINAARSVLT